MVEFTTGLSTRIGFPTEHIAKDTAATLKNPMYATGLGLILKGYEIIEREQFKVTGNEARKTEEKKVEMPATEQLQTEVEVAEAPSGKKWRFGTIIDSMKNWFEDDRVNETDDFQ